MKNIYKLLIFSFSLLIAQSAFSMGSPLMGGGSWNACGPDNFYDSGDIGGDYSNSESFTETYCSDAGDCIQFVFSAFNTESCCDDLTIYDGPNTGSPLIGTYAGTALPNGGTISSTSGCLTFVWSSDGSVVRPGWEAAFSCVPCPVPTCSDGIQNQGETGIDCGGPCPACGLNHNIGTGSWNTCTGSLFDTGGSGGSYGNSELITETYCSDAGDCISINFSSFATESCCDDLTIYDGPNTGSPLIGVYAGSTSPGTVTSTSGCLTFVWDSDGSVTAAGWQAAISCVACPAPTCSDGIQNQGETGIDCGGPCPACGLNHNTGTGNWNTCTGSLFDSGGPGSDYSNSELITETYCSDAGDCISFNFSSFATESCCDDLTIYDGPNTSSPLIGVYAGSTNPGTVNSSSGCLTFVWDSDGSVTGAGWQAAASCSPCPTCTDGILNGQEIGIDCGGPTCPACPCASLPIFNDEACCATPLTVNADLLCGSTTAGTVANATPSFNGNTCFGTDDDDVWFSFVATQTNHEIDLLNVAGSVTDMYHAVYGGTCSATGVALVCSDANSSTVTGLTVGNTYFIRVYTYTATGGQNSTFDVCVGTPPPNGPCGNPANNDYCSDPAILTQGGGGWSSSTTPLFSADTPANSGTLFCGSVENNSWYQFTALSSTEIFNFSSVTNCVSGIQAEVYDVTTDANGCCTNFTSMSNCWNPATATSGTVTATGLTIGNTYILMVDGFGGDNCDFTVSGWEASGILPVTLIRFEGYNYSSSNKLVWATQSEINNDYFIVQKSSNAKSFTDAGIVDGNGNSTNVNEYDFIDDTPFAEVTYYRLKQIDFDGQYDYSGIIAVETERDVDVTIYPNPSKDNLFFDLSESRDASYTVIYTNVIGSVIKEQINISEGTNTYQVSEFINLSSGIYFIQILNENGEVIKHQKIVKE